MCNSKELHKGSGLLLGTWEQGTQRRSASLSKTAHEPGGPPAKQLGVKVQKASRGQPTKPTSSPTEQISTRQDR
jgi:hypothetical protein